MSPTTRKHNAFTRFIFRPFRWFLKCINKEWYVKVEYRYITGHKCDFRHGERYTEKLQYLRLKVFPYDQGVIKCASRDGLREYASSLGLDSHLIKCYGVYDHFKDIDFDTLPNSFVMKCTHACGFNEIIYDKSKIDYKKLKKRFNKWLRTDYGKKTVETHYSHIKPRIIVEELLLDESELPTEYKIHVFNGKAKYLYVVTGRNKDIHYNNYLIDWTDFDEAQFNYWTKNEEEIKQPDNFDDAVKIAEKLARPFSFVRVDLYIINKKIYISEMTFTPAKGTLTFKDDKSDYLIGSWLTIRR